jgi:drug/metabolite transporter (DMT)-like permease
MIVLFFSILCSSLIFVIFRLFPRYRVNTFHAIVFNYFTACTCGLLLFGNELNSRSFTGEWPTFSLLAGILFISLFILMGLSSQQNGVALTSIAGKMSMAVSLMLMLFLYHEPLTILKVLGMLLAFAGVFLVTWNGRYDPSKNQGSLWMLLLLFFGSGILDVVLNYVQKYHLQNLSSSLFSAFGFGIAGVIGFLIMLYQIFSGKSQFYFKNILAGIILGIPNYFSIFLLMQSYTSTGWQDTTVLAIINVSVVLMSSVIGFSAFKESINNKKIIGLLTAITAILVLYFAGK